MKSIIPSRFEIILFVVMALVAGTLGTWFFERGTMLFVLTLPVFFISAMLGHRRRLLVAMQVTEELPQAAKAED